MGELWEIFQASFFLKHLWVNTLGWLLLGLCKIKRITFWQLPLHSSSKTIIISINKQTFSLQAFTQTCFLKELFWKPEYISKNVRGGSHFDEAIWYNATEAGLRNGHFLWVFSNFSKQSPSRAWHVDALLVFNNFLLCRCLP